MKAIYKQAWDRVGGLSSPSKMPCFGYSLPARECQTGGKLREVEGSTCFRCYAYRGNYMFPKIQAALYRRLESITTASWVADMVSLIGAMEGSGYFRWHDSGDLQSVDHLAKIVAIARELPHIQFWLPTREYGYVAAQYRAGGPFPANLTVRLSAAMVDGPTPDAIALRVGAVVSGVSTGESANCPSARQANKCLTCRACWDKTQYTVIYRQH